MRGPEDPASLAMREPLRAFRCNFSGPASSAMREPRGAATFWDGLRWRCVARRVNFWERAGMAKRGLPWLVHRALPLARRAVSPEK